MECHYHPEREATDVCAICGKTICKECGLEIAGKVYCKDCLEKIVGLGVENSAQKPAANVEPEQNIYQPQEEYVPPVQEEPVQEYRVISDDSPYNIKDNVEYSGEMESSYLSENENIYQQPPEVAQNEYIPQEEIIQKAPAEQDFIYPDHSYEPEPTTARRNIEDKYEKYLDDLYFDEKEIPLGEQLAKDEEQYGSLTRREYKPRPVEEEVPKKAKPKKLAQKEIPRNETPEEMEARIRAEILNEQKLKDSHGENIHNLNYQEEKEPMGVVDILLTILLIIVILIVLYYIIYLFFLNATYPTFMDAVFALKNPQNIINHILTSTK